MGRSFVIAGRVPACTLNLIVETSQWPSALAQGEEGNWYGRCVRKV